MRLNFAACSRLCARLLLLAALVQPASAALRPSLDYAAWQATDIALVDATSRADVFEVAESWKGDLRPGDRITVPELKPSPNAAPISLYPKNIRFEKTEGGGFSTQIPKLAAGSQMVLFLKRRRGSETSAPATSTNPPAEWQYSTVFKDDPQDCAVWIDGAQLYHFWQLSNPGTSFLIGWDMSIGKLKDRVTEIVLEQQDLAEVVAIEDGGERAKRLKSYVLSSVPQARTVALQELAKCGPAASATIRGMLDDPAFADEASGLFNAYVKAGGEAVGEELNRRLQKELAFWRATAPHLSEGWWNENAKPRQEHFNRTFQLIVGLEQTHSPAALGTATQFCDLWRSIPLPHNPNEPDQMTGECDKLIHHLQAN